VTPEAIEKAPTQRRTFGARPLYILALAGLTGLGVLGSAFVSAHERHVGIFMWALTGLYLLALATVASLRVGVSADGLSQRWLFSHLKVAWRDIARLEKTPRGYVLCNDADKELALLFLLPPLAQQIIADEAITHARLRPSKTAPIAPVLEQWERKPK